MECEGQNFFSFWTVSCPFTSIPHQHPPPTPILNNPKNQNFEKMKKLAGDIIILYRCTINDNYMMYGSWDMEHVRQNFCHFGPFYALLLPPPPRKNVKNKNFEKLKKIPGDIIILQWCTKNHDHMLYCSWDMAHNRCNCYFSFWTIFCPFTPLTTQKIKILKKWKKHLEILSFYTSVPKIMIICYTVPEIWRITDLIVIFHFGLFFALLPP